MPHTISHEALQPPAHDRIREHSSDSANQRIDRETRGAIEEALRDVERLSDQEAARLLGEEQPADAEPSDG